MQRFFRAAFMGMVIWSGASVAFDYGDVSKKNAEYGVEMLNLATGLTGYLSELQDETGRVLRSLEDTYFRDTHDDQKQEFNRLLERHHKEMVEENSKAINDAKKQKLSGYLRLASKAVLFSEDVHKWIKTRQNQPDAGEPYVAGKPAPEKLKNDGGVAFSNPKTETLKLTPTPKQLEELRLKARTLYIDKRIGEYSDNPELVKKFIDEVLGSMSESTENTISNYVLLNSDQKEGLLKVLRFGMDISMLGLPMLLRSDDSQRWAFVKDLVKDLVMEPLPPGSGVVIGSAIKRNNEHFLRLRHQYGCAGSSYCRKAIAKGYVRLEKERLTTKEMRRHAIDLGILPMNSTIEDYRIKPSEILLYSAED